MIGQGWLSFSPTPPIPILLFLRYYPTQRLCKKFVEIGDKLIYSHDNKPEILPNKIRIYSFAAVKSDGIPTVLV